MAVHTYPHGCACAPYLHLVSLLSLAPLKEFPNLCQALIRNKQTPGLVTGNSLDQPVPMKEQIHLTSLGTDVRRVKSKLQICIGNEMNVLMQLGSMAVGRRFVPIFEVAEA